MLVALPVSPSDAWLCEALLFGPRFGEAIFFWGR